MPNNNLEAGSMEQEAGKNLSPNTQQPRPKLKWRWWGLGIIILAAIGAGAYYYWTKNKTTTTPSTATTTTTPTVTTPTTTTTTTDPTASWKTYTNTKYNFSIKYSPTWTYQEHSDGMSATFQLSTASFNYITVQYLGRGTDYYSMSFDDYVKIAATVETQNYTKLKTSEKVTTNSGVVGYITTWQATNLSGATITPDPTITYFPLSDGKLTGTIRIDANGTDLSEYNKMIKTFKFTDATADWKNYTNADYGFSFKYPKDWNSSPATESLPENVLLLLNDNSIKQENNFIPLLNVTIHKKVDNPTFDESIIGSYSYTQKVDGADTKIYIKNSTASGNTALITFTNGNILEIRVDQMQDAQAAKTRLDQILSTFKFTDATADWKTYTNTDYGFSFKYPKDLTIDEIPFSAAVNQTRGDGPLLDVLLNAKDLQGAVFSVSVLNKSIDDAIKYDKSTYGVKTTEKGKVGTKLTGAFYGMEYAINGNYTYFFRQVNSRNTGDRTAFDQILSTFKFTQ